MRGRGASQELYEVHWRRDFPSLAVFIKDVELWDWGSRYDWTGRVEVTKRREGM